MEVKNREITQKDREFFERVDRIRKIKSSKEELYRFLLENVEKKGKRDIVRDSKALDSKFVVLTERKRVKGFYVDIDSVKFLPAEVQAFFFMLLDASGCKYILDKNNNK